MSDTGIALVTVFSAFVGLILWFGCLYRDRLSAMSFRQLLTAVLIAGIACRITFSLFTPIFYAPDEQSHFNYIRYLYENHSFPVQTSSMGATTNDWEYYQPPLYYLAVGPLYWITTDLLSGEKSLAVRMIRIFSILLWLTNVWFATRILNNLNMKTLFVKLFVISMISLLPAYTFLSSVINNDNLLITLGGAILYLITKEKSLWNSFLIGILLGLALLTKLNAVMYIFVIVIVLFFELVKKSLSWSSAIFHLFLTTVLATMIWTPWALRNWIVYGSFTAEKIANVPTLYMSPIMGSSIWDAIRSTQSYMKESFWAVSGIYNNIRFLPTLGIHLSYFSIIGLLYGLFLKRELLYNLIGNNRNFMIAIALAIFANVVLVFIYGILYRQGQGRFLFPLLIPISLFMAAGIKLIPVTNSKNSHVHIVGFFITYALSFTSYSLGVFSQI